MVGDGTWLTVAEVAALLGIGDNTVRRYADDGRLDDPIKVKRLPSGYRRIHKDSAARLQAEMDGEKTQD